MATFVTGQPLDAADLEALVDAWTTYTPTWTASAGTPSIGNGTLGGRYQKMGRTVHLQITLLGGTTTTIGTAGAYWNLGLPPGHTTTARFVGAAYILDSGTSEYAVMCSIDPGGTVVNLYRADSSGDGRRLNNSIFTFGNLDTVTLTITYETTS